MVRTFVCAADIGGMLLYRPPQPAIFGVGEWPPRGNRQDDAVPPISAEVALLVIIEQSGLDSLTSRGVAMDEVQAKLEASAAGGEAHRE